MRETWRLFASISKSNAQCNHVFIIKYLLKPKMSKAFLLTECIVLALCNIILTYKQVKAKTLSTHLTYISKHLTALYIL